MSPASSTTARRCSLRKVLSDNCMGVQYGMAHIFWHKTVNRPITNADAGRFIVGKSPSGWLAGFLTESGPSGPMLDGCHKGQPDTIRVCEFPARVCVFERDADRRRRRAIAPRSCRKNHQAGALRCGALQRQTRHTRIPCRKQCADFRVLPTLPTLSRARRAGLGPSVRRLGRATPCD